MERADIYQEEPARSRPEQTMTWIGTRLRARLHDEAGFTLVELLVALSVLSIAFFALAAAASTGLRVVAEGRQREAATEIANGRLEHLRNIPYENAQLEAQPTHSSDSTNPDYNVSSDGSSYNPGSGNEPLVVDTTNGQVAHIEDPVTVGPWLYTVYQYVTWIDDPVGGTTTQDYKRLSIVVAYKTPINTGRPRSVQVTAFFTTGGVIVPGTSQGATQGTPGATPTPTPTPTATGPCVNDHAGPTGDFTIISSTGAVTGYTNSTSVSVSVAPVDGCTPITMQFSNDNTTYGAATTYDSLNPSTTWVIAAGDGSKSVWATYSDGATNASTIGPHTIVLDQTKPTVAGTLSRTVSCSGVNRTTSLAWGASTDTNFLGYRIYKSVNGAAYTTLATTSGNSYSDIDKKSLDSLSYKVVGYDKAGNESNPTNVISLSKNQCS